MPKSKKEIISMDSISKIYHLGNNVVKALDDVSISIYENDFISIMGPSGSGKSTLMNMIGCLDVPTKGVYKFNNELISEMNDSQLANIRNEKIGFVFQTFNLLPKLTSLKNVEVPLIYSSLGKKKRLQRSEEALSIVGLSDRMDHKPSELSGGQRQRVAIARAFLKDAPFLILDEATSHLDALSEHTVHKALNLLKTNRTTIIIAHRLSTIRDADRIIVLNEGKMVEAGTHNELLQKTGLYRQLVSKQLSGSGLKDFKEK